MNERSAGASDCRTLGTIAEMVRCFRERRLWTQATLADRAGLPEKTISALETGYRRKPHLTTLELLADALELGTIDREALRASRDPRPPQSPEPPAPLPLPATTFVGRDEPARQVLALLGQPSVRLLTLTGTGGIGKTRLALHVAATVADRFAGGAVFVDCSAVRDPALVPGAIAQAVKLRVPGGQPVEAALGDYFAARRILLVLDNVEQVLGAAPIIDRLVAGSSGLVVLVTSRERLALARERVYRVGAMTVPDPLGGTGVVGEPGRVGERDMGVIAQSEAVQLFVQRATAARSTFALTPANAADVAAICAGMDGIPLAIELAAARLAHAGTPTVLRERLDRRLGWLATTLRDQVPRHRTMRAAIEWSYDALDPADQRLFRHLAVFAGGFTIDAVEATIAGMAGAPDAALDGIASLVEKSLIQVYDSPNGGTRYRILEPIRDFGAEHLRASGEEAPVRSAHGATFLAMAERGEEELSGPHQREWLARLETDGDNIRAALSWAIDQHDAERACRLGGALWRFWAASGRVAEGRRFLEQALALDEPATSADPAVRVKALRRLGNLAIEQADYAAARAAFAASMDLARATGDETARKRALSSVGFVAYNLGDYEYARACLAEAHASWDDPEDARVRAAGLFSLGAVAFAEGRSSEAEELYRASLQLRHALGDEFGAAHVSIWMGQIARVTGRSAEARQLLEDALTIVQAGGEQPGEGLAMLELAQLALAEGDSTTALDLAQQSLAIRHTLGDLHSVVDALDVIALILWGRGEQGDVDVGARLAGAADAWRRSYRVPLIPPLRAPYEAARALARAEHGERAFTTSISAGESMPAERAAAWYLMRNS